MGNLFLLTDAYPYGKGEDFISNEIDQLAQAFKQIFIVPCGLMCDTSTCRELPENVIVLPPKKTSNLYAKYNNPSKLQRIGWSIRYMGLDVLRCLFSKYFYRETKYVIQNYGLDIKKIIRIIRHLSPCLRNVSYFEKLIKASDFDKKSNTIYSFWFDYSQIMFYEIMKRKNIDAPVKRVSRGHRHDIYEEENNLNYLPFRNIYFSCIDKLYLSTLDGYQYMKNKYPDFENKIALSYLGTKDHGYDIPKNTGAFRIVSCSFASPVKRVDLIIKALSCLESDREIEWIYFGDGLLYEELKKEAAGKLTNNIKYIFKGYTPNTEMLHFYSCNDIHLFVNVSTSEGLPVSIQEAISFAIPIIATDVGSTREAVINGKNGYLLDKEFDVQTLSERITDVINADEETFRQLSLNSRKLWEENFNAENIYAKFISEIS